MKPGVFLVGVLSGIAMIGFDNAFGNKWAPFAGGAMWVVGLLATIFLHEAGHALAARIAGWQVIACSVGWLGYQVHNRQIALSRLVKAHDAGGWVFAVPSSPIYFTRIRYIAFVAGGPLASLAQFAGALAAGAWVLGSNRVLNFRVDYVAMAFAYQGLAAFCGTAIPGIMRKNDADRILLSIRSWRQGVLFSPAGFIIGMTRYKVRLRDLPSWMLDRTWQAIEQNHADNPIWTKWWRALEIGRALDHSHADVKAVRSLINTYLSDFAPDDWLRTCDIYLAAVHERDLARAEALASDLTQANDVPQMEYAARAGLAMLRGDRAAAADWLARMDAQIAKSSPFKDLTFIDIRRQVEGVLPLFG